MTPFYESTSVTIYNARWEDVWPTLGLSPKDVALCWADPPYGINYQHGGRKDGPSRKVVGDADPYDPRTLLSVGFQAAVLWGANYYASRLPDSAAWWTWDKRNGDWAETHQAEAELAWTNLPKRAAIFRHLWCANYRASEHGVFVHPTQKPVALCEWGFERAGLNPGDLVFAPYLGSGPEVRAALNMGLCLIGCEVDADYCRTVVEHRVALAAPRRGQEGQSLLPFGAP